LTNLNNLNNCNDYMNCNNSLSSFPQTQALNFMNMTPNNFNNIDIQQQYGTNTNTNTNTNTSEYYLEQESFLHKLNFNNLNYRSNSEDNNELNSTTDDIMNTRRIASNSRKNLRSYSTNNNNNINTLSNIHNYLSNGNGINNYHSMEDRMTISPYNLDLTNQFTRLNSSYHNNYHNNNYNTNNNYFNINNYCSNAPIYQNNKHFVHINAFEPRPYINVNTNLIQ
jgi:hypothetical protein